MYWQGFFRPDAECSKTQRGRERGEMDWKRADARMRARNAGSGCVCSCVHACACVCWSRCRWRMSVLKNSWCHVWRFLGDILLFNWPYRAGVHGTRSRARNTHRTRALRVRLLKRHGIKERVRSKKHGEAEIQKVRKERSFWYLAFSSRWFSVSSIPRGFLCHTKVPRSIYLFHKICRTITC